MDRSSMASGEWNFRNLSRGIPDGFHKRSHEVFSYETGPLNTPESGLHKSQNLCFAT